MEKIEAKAVIDGKYWILKQNKTKVGQVTHDPAGYKVRIHGKPAGTFKDLDELRTAGIAKFTDVPERNESLLTEVHGYPVNGFAYNPMWNLHYKLPLYTQTPDSKSWYAAGYYHVRCKGKHTIEYCPKLITLQRNDYEGPFKQKPSLLNSNLFEETT